MSQIISRGLGGGAGIPQVILFRGLSVGVLPPPPVPGISSGTFQIINPGDIAYSFDAFSSIIYTDGIEFSLPPRANQITWQSKFGSAPAIASLVLQGSLDGITWGTLDSSSNVSGEVRTIDTSSRFIRAAILDMTEGVLTTVMIRVIPMEMLE